MNFRKTFSEKPEKKTSSIIKLSHEWLVKGRLFKAHALIEVYSCVLINWNLTIFISGLTPLVLALFYCVSNSITVQFCTRYVTQVLNFVLYLQGNITCWLIILQHTNSIFFTNHDFLSYWVLKLGLLTSTLRDLPIELNSIMIEWENEYWFNYFG